MFGVPKRTLAILRGIISDFGDIFGGVSLPTFSSTRQGPKSEETPIARITLVSAS